MEMKSGEDVVESSQLFMLLPACIAPIKQLFFLVNHDM